MSATTTSTARAGRRYLFRFSIAMAAYAVLLPLSLFAVGRLDDSAWRYPIALLPLLPFVAVAVFVWRLMVETDELARRIQVESLAIAFAAGSVLTFGYGLLQGVGLPPLSWLFVWPVYAVCWLIGSFIARRRYA